MAPAENQAQGTEQSTPKRRANGGEGLHAPHLPLGPDGRPNFEHSGSLVWMLAVTLLKTNVAAKQKCQHYRGSAAVPQSSVSAACTDGRLEALRAVGPQSTRVAQTLQSGDGGQVAGRMWQWRTRLG
jgi:hypothetical protein